MDLNHIDIKKFTPDTPIWLPDEKFCWVKATILQVINDSVLRCQIDDLRVKNDDNIREFVIHKNLSKVATGKNTVPVLAWPHLRNTTLNEDRLDDLTTLSHLSEPAVLNTIQSRYFDNNIYTYSGLVLVSLNPYCDLGLYEESLIQAYSGKARGELEPHLFAVAEDAFRSMQREGRNQSIIISGESGAGKTISARYVMRYFATVDSKHLNSSSSVIEARVLASNPILEAFGNAKTIRNDNSSRFGKYVQIFFDERDEIRGAAIKTYLLEKTRVVQQSVKERNYHIFYQLLSGANEKLRSDLRIKNLTWSDFEYLAKNGGNGRIEGVDDLEEFKITLESLKLAGFTEEIQVSIFKILSAILHLGNVKFQSHNEEEDIAEITSFESLKSVKIVSELLGCVEGRLVHWLVKKPLKTSLDVIEISLTLKQAEASRDAVAKYLYSRVFEFVVEQLNNLLRPLSESQHSQKSIGVLDIYGFEKFDQCNSFEQFCINYANEKLQHEFNDQVFRIEQEIYEKEQISWSFINFSDNLPTIETIEGRGGIIDLLDEECKFPNGSDESFLAKIKSRLINANSCTDGGLIEELLGKKSTFTIKHFAYNVSYDIEGFLDKNRDAIPLEVINILFKSTSASDSALDGVLNNVISNTSIDDKNSSNPKQSTTGSAFRKSLIELMKIIKSTQVHYIRCIKPNTKKSSQTFESDFVLQQLRAGGIIETIKISAAGYPARWSFEEFYNRYNLISCSSSKKKPSTSISNDYRELTKSLLISLFSSSNTNSEDSCTLTDSQYQIGLTQIFLRSGVLGDLEGRRSNRLKSAAILIQAVFKGNQIVTEVKEKISEKAKVIQNAFKASKARAQVKKYKDAIRIISSAYRRFERMREVNEILLNVRLLQIRFKAKLHEIKKKQSELSTSEMGLKEQMIKEESVEEVDKTELENDSAAVKAVVAVVDCGFEEKLQEEEVKVSKLLEEIQILTINNEKMKNDYDKLQLQLQSLQIQEKLESEQELQLAVKKEHELESELVRENEELKIKYAKLEGKYGKLEEYIRNLMKRQVITTYNNNDTSNNSITNTNVNTMICSNGIGMASQNSLLNFINEQQQQQNDGNNRKEGDAKLIKFTSNSQVLEDLLLSGSVLEELMELIKETSEVEDLNEDVDSEADILKPSFIILSWIQISLSLGSSFYELTEFRVNTLLECIRNTLSASADDRKCSLWMKNLINLYGMIHFMILEKEEKFRTQTRSLSTSRSSCTNGSASSNSSKSIESIESILEETEVGEERFYEYNEGKKLTFNDCIKSHDQTNITVTATVSEATSSESTQISQSALAPSILILIRAELFRLIDDIYSAWLKELCRWFGRAGLSAILDYQGLKNYLIKPTNPTSMITSTTSKKQNGTGSKMRLFESVLASFVNNGDAGKVKSDHNIYNHMASNENINNSNSNIFSDLTVNDFMDSFHDLIVAMTKVSLEPEIVTNILEIILKHCAISCFNQFLLRRRFISWKRAIQIQYNLSQLEEFLTSLGLDFEPFNPLLEAVKIVQLAKTKGVDAALLQQCGPNLSARQIKRILTNYTTDDYEDGPVPVSLIKQFSMSVIESQQSQSQHQQQYPELVLLSPVNLNSDLSLKIKLNPITPPSQRDMATSLPLDMPPTLWKLFVLYLN